MRDSGHNVIVTGASRGIGLAIARKFHDAGNRVVLVARNEPALAKAAAELPGAITAVADVANASDRKALAREFTDISVLVNNAGIQVNGPFQEMPEESVEAEVLINLLAPMLLARAFLPTMLRQPESAIVNVTSVLGLSPKESAPVYSATKAALRSFTRTLRWQLQSTPVRVFEVLPPMVDTDMTTGRGTGKISPMAVAQAFWRGFTQDKFEQAIGKAAVAKALATFAPPVAGRILRHG